MFEACTVQQPCPPIARGLSADQSMCWVACCLVKWVVLHSSACCNIGSPSLLWHACGYLSSLMCRLHLKIQLALHNLFHWIFRCCCNLTALQCGHGRCMLINCCSAPRSIEPSVRSILTHCPSEVASVRFGPLSSPAMFLAVQAFLNTSVTSCNFPNCANIPYHLISPLPSLMCPSGAACADTLQACVSPLHGAGRPWPQDVQVPWQCC